MKIIRLSFMLFFLLTSNIFAKDVYLSCESPTQVKSSFVIIDKIPNTDRINPSIWNLLVFSILSKKHKKIIAAGIAVLKREALITWVWTNDKYVKVLNKPTLVKAKKNNKGKLVIIVSLCLIISL